VPLVEVPPVGASEAVDTRRRGARHSARSRRRRAEPSGRAATGKPAEPAESAEPVEQANGDDQFDPDTDSALLTRAVGPRPRPATPPARRSLADRFSRIRRPWLVGGAAVVVVAAGTGIAWAAVGSGQASTASRTTSAPPPASASVSATAPSGSSASTTAPASTGASRAGGTQQASAGSTVAPVSLDATKAAGVLADLDALRERAFATRSAVLLTGVYPSGALLTQDTQLLDRLVPNGCGLQGVKTTYQNVKIVSRSADSVVVSAAATLAQSVLICDGAATARAPGSGPSPLQLTLSWRKSGYLIAGISS
jgi:hypothetical protein